MGVTGSLVSETMMHMLMMNEKAGGSFDEGNRTGRSGSKSARYSQNSARSSGRRSSQTARDSTRSSGRTRQELQLLRSTVIEEVQRRQAAEKKVAELEDKVNKLIANMEQPQSRGKKK